MNNDIKEIREYISCPQFGDDHYGKWGALRLDQRIKIKKLLDYITNLQESEAYYYGQCKDYQSRIDKAIEYIKSCTWSNGIDNELQYSLHVPTLLNILNGEDKE